MTMEHASTPFAMVSPHDGSQLSSVRATAPADLAEMTARARAAQAAWGALAPVDRSDAIRPLKQRILERAEAIAREVHLEVGKPEVEALLGEVLPSADVVDYWCDEIETLLEPSEVAIDAMAYPKKSGTIYREARGVVAIIMPWNFPFALPLRVIVPALLAGNAVLLKPSEVSPRSGAIVASLLEGLVPPGVFQLVQGGRDVGAALCASEVDLVAFTGSVATGRHVARACAERLTPCSLELGGKDAAIVLDDADVERAANGIVWGAFLNAGQNCGAIERVYVARGIAEPFIKRVTEATAALRPGVDIGPLTTETQCNLVEEHVRGAVERGAKILHGGERGSKYQFAPTVLTVDSDDMPLMQDETFGPVLPILIVDGADEAIRRANASRFGLTASLWTRDTRAAESMAKRLRAGVVTINNHSFTGALPGAPWSGFGETGYGITNSPLALEALTRPRFVLVDRSSAARELWWYPYTATLRVIAVAMATLRNSGASFMEKAKALFALLGAFPKRMRE